VVRGDRAGFSDGRAAQGVTGRWSPKLDLFEGGQRQEQLFDAGVFEVDGDFGVAAAVFGGDDGTEAEGFVADAVAGAEGDADDGLAVPIGVDAVVPAVCRAVADAGGGGGVVAATTFVVVHFVPGEPAVASGADVFAAGLDVTAAEIDVVFVEVVDEAGAGVVAGAAGEGAAESVDEVELLLGAGAADVAEATFFFHGCGVVEGALVGEDAFFHADEEDDGEFETFGGVKGDEGDGLGGIVAHGVDVGDEGDVFEEGGEGGFGGDLGVVGGDRTEFEDVLPAVFGVVEVTEEEVLVAGFAEEDVDDFFERPGFGDLLGVLDHLREGEAGAGGAGGEVGAVGLAGVGGSVEGGEAVLFGPDEEFALRFLAEGAGGDVDDALESDGVGGVRDEAEVGEDVFDFAAGVEAGAADDAIGDATSEEGLLDDAGLGVGAIHDGDVAGAPVAFRDVSFDLLGDEISFVGFGVGLVNDGVDALVVVGPELLVDAFGSAVDDGVGDAEDGFGGAVVLFETNDGGVREVTLEVEDVADVGGAPGVDGLVGVADDGEVVAAGGPVAGEVVLDEVGVLEFVDEGVAEAALVALGDLGLGVEEVDGTGEEVVEVEGVVLFEGGFVVLVEAADDFFKVVAGAVAIFGDGEAFVLGAGDGAADGAGAVVLRVDAEVGEGSADDEVLVGVVIDDEFTGDADGGAVDAEDAGAGAVEGAEGHAFGGLANESGDAVAEFAGGFLGKGDAEDLVGSDALFLDEPGDAVGDDAGFAAAGAGDDEEGAAGMRGGFRLGGVEAVEKGGGAESRVRVEGHGNQVSTGVRMGR